MTYSTAISCETQDMEWNFYKERLFLKNNGNATEPGNIKKAEEEHEAVSLLSCY